MAVAAADRARKPPRRRVLVASTPHLKPRSPKAPSEHRLFMLTILLSLCGTGWSKCCLEFMSRITAPNLQNDVIICQIWDSF